MRTMLIALLVVGFASTVSSGAISLVADTNMPEPNEEITVYVQTDAPLFAMGLGIEVIGDANITTAMCEADCNQYGWDNGWNSDPYFEDNWVYLSGVSWPSEANGVVGYIKFRYNSGQVTVSIFESEAFDANCQFVKFSDVPLVFGQPDPNDYNEQGDSSSQDTIIDENIPATAESPNDVNLPIVSYWQDKQAQRQKHLMRCPADSNSSREISSNSRINWEAWERERSLDKEDAAFESMIEDNNGQMLMDGEPNVIEINSDITTNQIWTANNIYWVTVPINVQALLVIEPNTVVMFGDDYGYYDCAIFVNNGGTLISKGTPDKPIIYTCDFLYPGWGYYWQYLPDDGQYYFCPIYIEQTASPATTVTYSFIEGAVIGIATDNITLDHPIENNYLFGNLYGIGEYGTKHTDIRNNLCYYNYYSGIDVHLADVNGVGDANSVITIVNNTCDTFQDNGITVHGVGSEGDAGLVMLINNIVSQSYVYGLNLVDGYMIGIVSNTGYYGNPANKNWEFEEDNPVIVTQNPFTTGSGYFDLLYLNQNCPFINAGLEYVEETPLIGTTTDINDTPDSSKIDIGFHHPNWDYSNAGEGNTLGADYDGNFKVDFKDFAILANGWQSIYDVNDFSQMADEWLLTISGHPPISVSVNGDVNNISGEVGVSVADCSYSTSQVYIFMDGQLIGETDYNEDEGAPGITVNTPSYRNGSHSFKGVITDHNGLITLSENLAVDFNNPLQCLSINDTYEPNQPLRLLGISATDNNLMVKLSKWDGGLIWSQQTSGNLDLTIPGGVLAGQIYDVSIEQEISGLLMLESSWETIYQKAVTAIYDANKPYKFAIILPNAYFWESLSLFNSADCRKDAVAGIVNDCNIMGIEYIILYKDQCTWGNFAKVLSKPTVFYAYVVSRGGMGLYGASSQRTNFKISDGYVVSNLDAPLGGGWDGKSNVHSMASLGFGGTDKFKIVWIDVCYNGYGNYLGANDMARAWMDLSEAPILDKLYVSWNTAINTSNDSCYGQWSAFFWGNEDGFGLYGANSYYQAFTRAQIELDCVGNELTQNSILGTIGDTSIRFTGNRYDY